jgi:hypothetical protein
MKNILAIAAILGSGSLGCAGAVPPCPHVPAPVSIEVERPLTVRAEAGSLWTSAHVWTEPRRTWSLPARGPVHGLAITPLPEIGGHAVTFRQGSVEWRGELDAARAARGPLQVVATPIERAKAGEATAHR